MASLRTLLLIIAVALPVWVGLSLAGPNPGGDVSPGKSTVSQATRCPGDFDGNGMVNLADFLAFAGGFGATSGDANYDARLDMDDNGAIDLADFLAFAAVFGTTCETPAQTESIPDANLRAVIEEALGKASGVPITRTEMAKLIRLYPKESGIRDLTGLEHAVNLTRLSLWDNTISDVSALSGLTNLTYLDLGKNNISDISTLSGLTNLTQLWLWDNDISDISALSGLTNLTYLNLGRNNISDISALSGLTNLNGLSMHYNPITEISALSGLTNLKGLSLGGSTISDISVLSGLTNLTDLLLTNNDISDISALSGLTNLTRLQLLINNIRDVSPLSGLINLTFLNLWQNNIGDVSPLSGLTNLTNLYLGDNNISDISALSGLTNLTELGLDDNTISDITALSGLVNLTTLILDQNDISDISALSGLTNLTRLSLGLNDISDVSALSGLTNLTRLSLWFNKIADISPLRGLTNLTELQLSANPLNARSYYDHLPALENRGVSVSFTRLRKGDFDVELVFSDAFREDEKDVLRFVARRWMSVISGDLPDYVFTEGWSGKCGDQPYTIPAGEGIDDLRIYVTTTEEDGVAGRAWTSLLREQTHLPVVGCMAFNLESANLWVTGLHEIGHVLGFGTIWDDLGFYRHPPDGDKHFNGPLAISAFDEAGGRNYPGAKVPLADAAHWSGDAFGEGELMLPWGGGALSAITVQSLADLGYVVDVTQADPFTLQGAAGKAVAKLDSAPLPVPGFGVDVGSVGVVNRYGVRPYDQGRVVEAVSSGATDDRLNVHWRTDFSFGNFKGDFGRGINGLADRHDPPDAAESRAWCGAGLRSYPIHVVDQQGRIVRTIGER